MPPKRRELRPAGILDIARELVADAVLARSAGATGGALGFLACAYGTLTGIGWLHDRVAGQVGLKVATGLILVLTVPLCAVPWWLMGIIGAFATAGWRARLWRRAALIRNGRSLVDLDSVEEVERVRYWLASGARERVVAMGDDALPTLVRLLGDVPLEAARLEGAAMSGSADWERAVVAYKEGVCPEILRAFVSLGSPSALSALERARPAKPFIERRSDAEPVANPMYEDFTIAMHRLATTRR
jgi:hypothetical protein